MIPHEANIPDDSSQARRGLTLVELLIALSITAVVAGATAAMIGAFVQATEHDRQWREAMIRAQAINVRLASYVAPARYVLGTDEKGVALWLDDTRESDTVHATEIRWLVQDQASELVIAQMVKFPTEWDQAKRDAYDAEYPLETDWWSIRDSFKALGLIEETPLCDEVSGWTVENSESTDPPLTLLTFSVQLTEDAGGQMVITSSSIRAYEEPAS